MRSLIWLAVCLFGMMNFYTLSMSTRSGAQEIMFWRPETWTKENFMHWDWRMVTERFVDTPIHIGASIYRWAKDPALVPSIDVVKNMSVFIDMAWENAQLYHKGVLMEVNGLWLQHRYDKALKRFCSYMTYGLIDVLF